MRTKKKEMIRMMLMIIDHLDHLLVHPHEVEENIVVEDDIDDVVDIHHHQVHVLRIQVHRLIVLVRHQVVHIEDIDADDHVSYSF